MAIFDSTVSKEEKEKILSTLGKLEGKISLLQGGSKDDLIRDFTPIITAIESYLLPNERLEIRDANLIVPLHSEKVPIS